MENMSLKSIEVIIAIFFFDTRAKTNVNDHRELSKSHSCNVFLYIFIICKGDYICYMLVAHLSYKQHIDDIL